MQWPDGGKEPDIQHSGTASLKSRSQTGTELIGRLRHVLKEVRVRMVRPKKNSCKEAETDRRSKTVPAAHPGIRSFIDMV